MRADLPHFLHDRICHRLFLDGVAGANACLCKPLIGTADKEKPIFATRVFAVDYSQGIAALMAEDQALQRKIVGAGTGRFAATDQKLHLFKGFRADHWLMCPCYDHPILWVLPDTLLGFIAELSAAALHHVANIGLVLQHVGNALAAPQAGIRAGMRNGNPRISGWRGNALSIEPHRDLTAGHPLQRHLKNPAYDGSRFLIDDDLVFLGGMQLVAVYRFAADE